MFFKKTPPPGPTLSEVVPRITNSGYLFLNINNDLGVACDRIMESSNMVQMAYGYARRTAMAALYVQGVADKPAFEHACGMFKKIQINTEHTVEFQEAASEMADRFMQEYHPMIGGLFEVKLLQIAREYEIPPRKLSDADLFSEVIDTVHAEQCEAEARHSEQIEAEAHAAVNIFNSLPNWLKTGR